MCVLEEDTKTSLDKKSPKDCLESRVGSENLPNRPILGFWYQSLKPEE